MAAPTMNESALTAVEACPAEEREHLLAAMAGAELTFEQALKLAMAEGPALDAYFVYPEELKSVARVQAFRDFLVSNAQRWSF